MRNAYKYIFLPLFLLFICPLSVLATHIVGGTLTYVYNGSNSYTVTLTLYRDCGVGSAAYPPSVTIQVQQADGSEFAPSRDIINIPGGTISNVPYSLDTCAEPPNPIPCVQMRTYTSTVTLPPVAGGYHLYYQLCCRNSTLSNTTTSDQTAGQDGESFYAFIPGTSIWNEDFTLANGTTTDAGATAWTRTLGTTPPGYAQVQGNLFEVQGANNAQATWTSQVISISGAPGGANLSVDLSEAGTMDANDSIFVYYRLNGGPLTLFATNGVRADDFTTATATQNGLVGSTVQIVVRVHYDGSSPTSELYRFDNVLVYNSVSNNSPVYNLFPPLFLCVGNSFTFDHSATDPDGDSLYYSFYTPYADAAPTFSSSIATFTPLIWNAGYSASSPLNSGGPALTLNPSTGLLSGMPNSIGQFQVGIMTTEYRSGVKVSDMVRDFQFNIISCPPPAQALITPSGTLSVCSGSALTFPNNSDASATNWTWNFGDPGTTTDVSTLQFPAYTYPGPGTYTAMLITNAGTSCADTSTAVVTVTTPPASPVAGSSSPVCVGSTLNLTASTIAGATYTWTGPNSFTSSLQNPSITGVTSLAAGTYSVTATIAGCTGPAGTTTVVVNPAPAAPSAGSNSPVCAGTPLNLTASTIAGATYSWTGPNSFTSSLQNPSIASPTVAAAGTYSVTVTVGGCASPSGTTTVVVNPSPAAPVAGSNSPVCAGSPINLTSNTIAGATYSWTGPASFTSSLEDPVRPSATAAMAGTYSVTVTVAGCTGPAGTTVVVVNPIPAAPTAGSNSPVCAGSTLNLTSNTIAGATYSWTGPGAYTSSLEDPTRPSATTAMSGTYSVTVTVGGCTGPAGTTAVVVNPIPATPAPGSNSPVCTGATLNLTTTAVAGATYSWTGPNSFTSSLQNPAIAGVTALAAGTYSLTVTVAGCTSAAGTVTVVVNPTPAAPTAGSNSPVCAGTTINLTSNTIAGATYSWTGPASFSSALEDPSRPSATAAMAGTYSVTVTVGGCTSPAATTAVVVNPVPATPTAGSNSPICVGATLNLTTPAVAGATYSWTGPNSFSSSLQNPSITGATALASGTYSVTVTVAGCTSAPGTVTVTVNSAPVSPTASSNTPVCTGDTLFLSASTIAGATYSWTGPNSFASALQNPSIIGVTALAAGTYTVVANNGCSSSPATTTVVINPTPAAPVAGSNSPICAGSTLNLTSNTIAGAVYSWTGPGGFYSSLEDPSIAAATTGATGTYSVTATVGGCTSPVATTAVVVNPIPPAPSPGSNSPVCTGAALNLTTTPVAGATYSWTGPNSFSSSLQNPTIAGTTLLAAGTYSLTVTVAGCTSPVGTVTVVVNPTPAAPVAGNNSPICAGSTLNLTSNTVVGATYSWTGPAGFTSSLEDPSIPSAGTTSSGTYSVTVTVSGCTSPVGTTTAVVNPIPATPAAGSNSPICVGATLNLTTPAVAGATYSWTGPNSFSSSLQNPSISGATALASGTYTVTVTVAGCTSPGGTVNVSVNTAPVSPTASSNTPVCAGDTLFLSASSIAGATYSWTGPNSFASTLQNPSVTGVTALAAGTYTVIANNGCASSPATTTVVINPTPAAPAAGNNSPLCSGSTLNLTSNTIAGATYSWTGPGGFTSSLEDPSIAGATAASTGTYSVTVTVGGCTGAAGTTVVTVDQPSVATAGSNQTVCANNATVALSGSVTGGSSTGIWTTSGSGTFSPSATSLTATYTPSNADTAAGSVTLTLTSTNNGACTASVSSLVLTITNAPVVNAGPDQSVCANNASTVLNGQVTTATGGTWSSSGTGTFIPDNVTLNATYVPSAADTASGTVTLTLTSTGNGSCLAVSDAMTITITDAPSANAGPDQFICLSSPDATLAGTVIGGAGTGIWTSSGSGTFSPNSTVLNATYQPSAADTAAGSVMLVLTTTANGGCAAVSDTMYINYTIIPTVNAGADQTVCANNSSVLLSGMVNGTSNTGIWSSSGSGTFMPSDTTLNATYLPSSADTAAGTVTLILSSTYSCAVVTDAMMVTITDAPFVSAGADVYVCSSNPDASLNGIISGGSTTGIWSTAGTGTITPSATSPSITYSPSAVDIAAGSIDLILTSTGNGNCNAVSDTVKVIITPPPSAFAGSDTSICGNTSLVLSGVISGGGGTGAWTTSGSGTFSPDAVTLNATYTPSSADTLSGSVILTLTSTNNGGCLAVSDAFVLTITDAPTANAGADQSVCSNNPVVAVSGAVTVATGGMWTTSGTGTFDNASSLNANYTPSAADIASGSVTLTLSTTGNGTCLSTMDSMTATFTPSPVVNAGSTIYICTGTTTATLNGTISGATTTGQWTTLGSGSFSLDTDLNAVYTLSAADTTAGTVSLVLTSTNNGNCFAVSDTVQVTITTVPTAFSGSDQVLCANNAAVLLNGLVTGGSGLGQWSTYNGTGTFSPSDTTLNGTYLPSAADTAQGYVSLVLTPINACLNPPDTMMVTITPAPFINAGSDQSICNGGAISLSASMNSIPSGMSWTTNGTGTFSPNDSSLSAVYTPSASDAGLGTLYFYASTTGNGNCVPAVDTMMVLLGNTPVAAFTSAGNCSGQSASFTDASTVSAGSVTSWNWDFGDGNTSSVQNPGNVYTAPGAYTVTLIASAGAGCSDTVSQVVIINPLPSAAFSYVSNCSSDTVAFADNSTITSGSIVSWNWDFGDLGTSALQDPTHVYPVIDTFTVVLSITSDSGCVASVTQDIIVTPRPVANFGYSIDCMTGVVTFTDTSGVMAGDSIVSWSWNFGNGNTSAVQNPSPQTYLPGTYTVQLQITTSAGCTATDTALFTVSAPPVADFIPAGGQYQVGQAINFTDQSQNSSAWYWDFGNNADTSIVQNPSYTYSQNGSYTITLIASNGSCSDTAAYQFEITGSPVIVPTAFSPNGDNLNDVFRIGGGPFKMYELRIFNEWGQQIFFSDAQANGWDGRYKAKDQPAGPYVYIFVGTTYKDEEIKLHGEIAITR
jgi:gliding motility-associated-like protein